MATGRFVAYHRVSTQRQGRSGLGLEAQREAVNTYLNGGDWTLVGEFIEVESGKDDDRPELAKALRMCRIHNATLVIAKLDRLSRNLAFIAKLQEAGVRFVCADMPEANELTIHIMAAMAQHERKAISDRTKAALAAAKARGVKLGGDRGNIRDVAHQGAERSREVRTAKANDRAHDLGDIIEDIRQGGATSLREIAQGLNDRGIPTARGGQWSAVQVKRVLDRLN